MTTPKTTCPKCGSASMQVYEHVDYFKEVVLKCYTCSTETIIRDTPVIEPPAQRPLTELQKKGIPSPPKARKISPSTKRYRKSPLFRVTNLRIQRRYRQSDLGKQTIKDQNKLTSILSKLEKLSRIQLELKEAGQVLIAWAKRRKLNKSNDIQP